MFAPSEDALTVCIIARNAERTIGSAVKSTLRALDRRDRVLVLDDASDDRTADIASSIPDPRVRIEVGTRRRGIPSARNALLDRVDTPLTAVLDADDITLPWRFRRQRELFRRGSFDLVFGAALIWKPPTPALKLFPLGGLSPEGAPWSLLLENPYWHPTMLARTDTLRELGGYRDVAAEDYDLWLRAAGAGKRIVRDAVPAIVYRRHRAQTTIDPVWVASQTRTTLVEEAFDVVARQTLGYSPPWFDWRRSRFSPELRPADLKRHVDVVRARTATLPWTDRRAVKRILRQWVP